jgi:hypothetical protein
MTKITVKRMGLLALTGVYGTPKVCWCASYVYSKRGTDPESVEHIGKTLRFAGCRSQGTRSSCAAGMLPCTCMERSENSHAHTHKQLD